MDNQHHPVSRRRRNPTRATVQQHNPKLFFQVADASAERLLRQANRWGRRGEATRFDDSQKSA